MILLSAAGCSSGDERLARFAEQAAERQAEQNRRMTELQKEVAEGGRRLVEADAKARGDFASLHKDLQSERSEVGRQRDALEEERREIASQRVTDPLVAAAVMDVGLLVACVLPLILCWQLLRRSEREDPADALVAEALLADLVAERPLLLAPPEPRRLTS
ncbi:MAG TPA: hypothetical protein VF170_10030, partial [Planctomycetaceae bacterium]